MQEERKKRIGREIESRIKSRGWDIEEKRSMYDRKTFASSRARVKTKTVRSALALDVPCTSQPDAQATGRGTPAAGDEQMPAYAKHREGEE
jgi:hypothetical protein